MKSFLFPLEFVKKIVVKDELVNTLLFYFIASNQIHAIWVRFLKTNT